MPDICSPNPEGLVTITQKEYDELKRESLLLQCLHAGGVDNWDYYDEAVKAANNGGKYVFD